MPAPAARPGWGPAFGRSLASGTRAVRFFGGWAVLLWWPVAVGLIALADRAGLLIVSVLIAAILLPAASAVFLLFVLLALGRELAQARGKAVPWLESRCLRWAWLPLPASAAPTVAGAGSAP